VAGREPGQQAATVLRRGSRSWISRSSRGEAGNSLIEAAGTGFFDEGEKLIRAHLDALPEVISDDDTPVLRRRVIDEQFRTPAVAIAA
jgi:hypothetical protein